MKNEEKVGKGLVTWLIEHGYEPGMYLIKGSLPTQGVKRGVAIEISWKVTATGTVVNW